MRALRLLALRRMRLQPLRAVLASLVVAAGVALSVAVVVVITSLSTSAEDAGQALAGPTPLRVIGSTARGGIAPETVARVEATEGVQAAIPLVQAITLAQRADGSEVPVLAFGVDCRIEALVGPFGCDDAALTALPTVSVASSLAAQLGPGAVLRTNVGRTALDGAARVAPLERLNDGRAVAVSIVTAQRLFARGEALDVIFVQTDPGADVDTVRHRLEAALGPEHGVLLASDPPPVIGVVLAQFLPGFTVIALLALAIGAVLVRNSVNLSIEERRRQTAIVAALGGSSATLVGGVLAEAVLLGVAGSAIGVLGGLAIAQPVAASLSTLTEKLAGFPLRVHLEPIALLVAFGVGITVALVAAVPPARRAARLDVAAELSNRERSEEGARATSGRRLALLAVGLAAGVGLCASTQLDGGLSPWQARMMPLALLFTTAMAALLLATLTPRLLAVAERATSNRSAAARLAAGNLCREPRRTGVMAVALGSAVAVGVLTASFNASVRTSVNRNLTANLDGLTVSSLDPGNAANIDAKLSPETLARLATLPGVGRVDRTATVVTGHEPGKLVVARAFSHPWLEDDVLAGIQDQARLEAGEVVIGPALARQEGIRPGDQVTLDTPTGRVALPVMGVVQDGNGGGRNILLSLALMERLFGPQPSSQVVVVPQPGTSLDTLAATIRSARLDPDLRVESRQEVVDRVARNVAQQLASFAALQRGLLVMSFVAVLSTLVLVGIQRQRELGMLAAVGMTPGELARMVLYEALLVSVTAVLVELPIGIVHYAAVLLLAPILIGFKNPFVLDLGAAASYALLAVGVAVVAAGWPAWQASRVEVGPALQYE